VRADAPRLRREFPNTAAGHDALVRWLSEPSRTVRVVMEATGLYGLDLALRLDAEGSLELMVANPRAVRHFAIALMERSKNDPIDTDVLVEFAQRMPFQRWVRPSAAALTLHALARRWSPSPRCTRRRRTGCMRPNFLRRLPAIVVRDLQRSLRGLERALHRLTRQAIEVIRQGLTSTSATNCCSAPAASVPPAPCRSWHSSPCSRRTWMSASGSRRRASTRAAFLGQLRA